MLNDHERSCPWRAGNPCQHLNRLAGMISQQLMLSFCLKDSITPQLCKHQKPGETDEWLRLKMTASIFIRTTNIYQQINFKRLTEMHQMFTKPQQRFIQTYVTVGKWQVLLEAKTSRFVIRGQHALGLPGTCCHWEWISENTNTH